MALVIGSAPDAVLAKEWNLSSFTYRVAINNSWQITPDWDYLVYPEDLPSERLPAPPLRAHQQLIDASQFVPVQNKLGGFLYASGTMASGGKYWEQLENFDATKLSQIDDLWLQVMDVSFEALPPAR